MRLFWLHTVWLTTTEQSDASTYTQQKLISSSNSVFLTMVLSDLPGKDQFAR